MHQMVVIICWHSDSNPQYLSHSVVTRYGAMATPALSLKLLTLERYHYLRWMCSSKKSFLIFRAILRGYTQEVTLVLLSCRCVNHRAMPQITPWLLWLTLERLQSRANHFDNLPPWFNQSTEVPVSQSYQLLGHKMGLIWGAFPSLLSSSNCSGLRDLIEATRLIATDSPWNCSVPFEIIYAT